MSIFSGRVVYFVEGSPSGEREMGKAFAACKEEKLKPKMIFKDELLELQHDKNSLYVIDDFKGDMFQYLKSKDCSIVGPRCMYSCVKKGIPIPENDSPICNIAMVGVVATASKISRAQKEELASLIGYMGGIYTDKFTTDVTHLITDGGKSPKFENAINIGLPIMSSSWVKAVWEKSLVMNVSASDPGFLKHRLPPFKGLYISCTNLPHLKKRRLQNIIESHAGIYMSTLEQNKTSVLIVGEPGGRKFQHAQLWGIPCLSPSWIHESVEKGSAVRMIDHIVQSQLKCSTPASKHSNFVNSLDISTIHRTQESNFISETDISLASTCSIRKSAKIQSETDSEYNKLLNNIDLSLLSNAGLFLDGCKIFLSGFTAVEMDKLKRIINFGGATLFTHLTDRLTHIIIGNADQLDTKLLIEFKLMNQTVSLKWLVASMKEGCPSRIEPYAFFEQQSPMGSLMEKENVDTNQRHYKSNLNETTDSINTHDVQENKLKIRAKEELEYFKKQTSAVEIDQKSGIVECKSLLLESIEVGPIFKGMAFKVLGFDDPSQIIKTIEILCGEVFSNKFQGKVDVTVVPLISFSDPDSLQTVTSLWLEDCYEQGMVVQVEYFHRPVSVTITLKPLEDCVFCITGFLGKERSFLVYLVEVLGAKIQESFSRKDHPEKGILRSTHLLCQSHTGSKFSAAVKWGIPTVSKDWLLQLLQSCLIDNKENEINEKDTATMTPVTKKCENYSKASRESLENLFSKQKSLDNVSFGSVGKSPFHVSTPETPYGQVFLNESQHLTSSTRKQWLKWINDLPELYHNSPEIKEFRKSHASTPLNVIMKQLWVKFGGATIEGIDPETGDLLPDGPYKQWVCKNESTSRPEEILQNCEDNCLTNIMTFGGVSKDLNDNLNDNKNFTSEVQKKSTSPGQDEYLFNEKMEMLKCSPSTSWRYVKRTSCESDDGPVWDFGKTRSCSVGSSLCPLCKRLLYTK